MKSYVWGCSMHIMWEVLGFKSEQQETGVLHGFVLLSFPWLQSAISLSILSLYQPTCHEGIRVQQAGKSSAWKILAALINHLPSAYHSWISPQHIAFPPSVYTFSNCFHFSSLTMVRLGYLAGTVSLSQDTQAYGLCPPLNFPLSLIKGKWI